MPKEYGKWFRGLMLEREDVDDADYITIDSADAEEAFKNASNFIEKIKDIITILIQQLSKI